MDAKNSLNVIYRKAVRLDSSAIIQAQLEMAFETEKIKLDPRICKLGVLAVFDDPTRGEYFVCEKNNQIIGCLLIVKEWSDWRNGEVWWIHSLYIMPQERGKKVYRGMYEYIQNLVNQSPAVRGIRLYVDKTNLAAQKVYEKLGMNGEHYHLYEWMKT